MRVWGTPLHLSDSPSVELAPAPALGEHTRDVLRDRLHLSEADLDALKAEGTI
jgi:glutaryl-CoA transferase